MRTAFLNYKIHDILKLFFFLMLSFSYGQNPLIMDQFTADPTARVFNGRIYVYPSHDIIPPKGEGRAEWFNMADYHVFSSDNLTQWKDHGVILDQKDVPWGDSDAYSMWAPDLIERNGKYYFYFPNRRKEAADGEGGFSIGVAISDKPDGPFTVHPSPIEGVEGIDPNVIIDKDGQAYLFWSQSKIYGAKLKDNMLELASEPKTFVELPQKGHMEGPFVFQRDGLYYMTYPHVANKIERLEYAVSDTPLGLYTHKGVIMDESPNGTWTNHHSITKYKGQWYLFYHDSELSPNFDKNRSIRADSLSFNEDGTIQKVLPTLRGVGISSAYKHIQLDRYSRKSSDSVESVYLDKEDTFKGWMLVFTDTDATVRYNAVGFGDTAPKELLININSALSSKTSVEIRDAQGNVIAKSKIKATDGFEVITLPVGGKPTGIKDLVLAIESDGVVQVDWIQFVK
ncbi:family 43 glycosylhydrolase [Galbibacter sp.]|uniref:family 43 glycosylhydrolase n=1 Tax=Galbibacter sp. TaxID=2918471 RepID=UPI003A8E2323